MSALAKNYNRRPISFKYGKGSFLYSTNGKKYLDFVQGIAVNSLGHSNPYLVKAVNKQSRKLWHVSNAFIIPEGEKLAKRLAKKTFADFIIFQNSGAEATEAAIKVARRYFYSIGQPSKNRILCVKNSFHGRTLATIYASGSKKMTEGFGPKVDGFDHFEFGNHKDFKKKITKRTAAIMVETVMGEGGIKSIPNWCLKELRKKFPKLIKEVRGVGLLIGLQLHNDQTQFIQKLMDNNLLTIRAAENVVRILPPLNVKKEEINIAINTIRKVCSTYK